MQVECNLSLTKLVTSLQRFSELVRLYEFNVRSVEPLYSSLYGNGESRGSCKKNSNKIKLCALTFGRTVLTRNDFTADIFLSVFKVLFNAEFLTVPKNFLLTYYANSRLNPEKA